MLSTEMRIPADLPKIVEIYNFAVATRESSCDLEPATVAARQESFSRHSSDHRPIWVAEDADAPDRGAVGYLGFYHVMNELARLLHHGGTLQSPAFARALTIRTGTVGALTCSGRSDCHASRTLGIEVLAVTIFASNQPSVSLFARHGFERWGYMPRVARLGTIERDLVMMGRRLV